MALATYGEARTEAAAEIGDPRFQLIKLEAWTAIYNRVTNDLAVRLMCLETLALFAIQATDDLYLYPEDMVQMTGLAFTSTPSDDTTFRWLDEIFEEEFRAKTSGAYPSGDPLWYYARKGNFFQLVPRPDISYVNGGQIAYCRRPSRLSVAVGDQQVVEATPLELPDWLFDHIVEGMVIRGLRRRRLFDDAAAREAVWRAAEADLVETMYDRSEDRRPSLRTTSLAHDWGGSE